MVNVGDDSSKLRFTLGAAPTGVLAVFAVQRRTYLPVQQPASNANIYCAAPTHIPVILARLPLNPSRPAPRSIHSHPHLQAGLLSNTPRHSNPFSSSRSRIHPRVDLSVSNSLSCCTSQSSRPFATPHYGYSNSVVSWYLQLGVGHPQGGSERLLLWQSIVGIWVIVVGYIRLSLLVDELNLYAVCIELPCTSTFPSFLSSAPNERLHRLAPHQSFLSLRGGRSTSVSNIRIKHLDSAHPNRSKSEKNGTREDVGNAGRLMDAYRGWKAEGAAKD